VGVVFVECGEDRDHIAQTRVIAVHAIPQVFQNGSRLFRGIT
jgi:hypothetical protein